MIVYLATRGFRYTIREYLGSWGRSLAGRVIPLTYDDVLAVRRLRAATYVFSDVERLDPATAARAASLWQALSDAGMRVLNHPTRSMRRYELLRTLRRQGTNRFDVHRVSDSPEGCRFPVFVREENDHGGSRTPLLETPRALAGAVAGLEQRGVARERLLITEFCDTADTRAVYRKYSAFVIGSRIVPRHVFFSTRWMLKVPDLVEADMLAEERAYVEGNPHEEELRAIFRLAHIEYGRIDYAVKDGALQVWEINTNPWLLSFRDGGGPGRRPVHEHGARGVAAAFVEIDCDVPPRRIRIARAPAPDAVVISAGSAGGGTSTPHPPASRWHRLGRLLARRSGLFWHEERLRAVAQRLRMLPGWPRRAVRASAPPHAH